MPNKIKVVGVFALFIVCGVAAVSPEPFDYKNVRWGMTEQEVIQTTGAIRETPEHDVCSTTSFYGYTLKVYYKMHGSLLDGIVFYMPGGGWQLLTNAVFKKHGKPDEVATNVYGHRDFSWKTARTLITINDDYMQHVKYESLVDLSAIRVQKFSNSSKL